MVGRPLSPAAHPKKEVREVLERLVTSGWSLREAGHWGRLWCPCGGLCTSIPVYGTPRNAVTHARRVAAMAARCPLPDGDPRRPPRGGVVV